MTRWNEVNLTTDEGKELLNQAIAKALGYYAEDVYNNGEWYLVAPDGDLATDEPCLNEQQVWLIADLPDWANNLEDANMLLNEVRDNGALEQIFTNTIFMRSTLTEESDKCVIRCLAYLEWSRKFNNRAFTPPGNSDIGRGFLQ